MTPTPEVTARTGVWFVGARGSVATTAVVGGDGQAQGRPPPPPGGTQLPELQPEMARRHIRARGNDAEYPDQRDAKADACESYTC